MMPPATPPPAPDGSGGRSRVLALARGARYAEDDARSVAAASAAPSSVVVPDPMPMKAIPSRVLSEEDYTETVSALIERDFFPDLPRLRVQHEIVGARAAGDRELAEDLRWKLANMHRATPASTPAASPGPGAPTARGQVAPAIGQPAAAAAPPPPAASAWERDDELESVLPEESSTNERIFRLADGKEVMVDLTHVRLDDFQRVFTSEDNAAFEEIRAKDLRRKREKYWWIEDAEKRHNTDVKAQTRALENGDPLPKGVVMFAEHRGRNALSYTPHGVPQPALEKPRVLFKNTRFTTDQQTDLDAGLAAQVASRRARMDGEKLENALAHAATEGRFDLSQLQSQSARAPGGRLELGSKPYGILQTPALLPGVDGLSPLMTYGKVASTPRLLDEEDRGPRFDMADKNDRELAAERLQRDAAERQRQKKAQSRTGRLKALGATPGEASVRPATARSTPGSAPGARRGAWCPRASRP